MANRTAATLAAILITVTAHGEVVPVGNTIELPFDQVLDVTGDGTGLALIVGTRGARHSADCCQAVLVDGGTRELGPEVAIPTVDDRSLAIAGRKGRFAMAGVRAGLPRDDVGQCFVRVVDGGHVMLADHRVDGSCWIWPDQLAWLDDDRLVFARSTTEDDDRVDSLQLLDLTTGEVTRLFDAPPRSRLLLDTRDGTILVGFQLEPAGEGAARHWVFLRLAPDGTELDPPVGYPVADDARDAILAALLPDGVLAAGGSCGRLTDGCVRAPFTRDVPFDALGAGPKNFVAPEVIAATPSLAANVSRLIRAYDGTFLATWELASYAGRRTNRGRQGGVLIHAFFDQAGEPVLMPPGHILRALTDTGLQHDHGADTAPGRVYLTNTAAAPVDPSTAIVTWPRLIEHDEANPPASASALIFETADVERDRFFDLLVRDCDRDVALGRAFLEARHADGTRRELRRATAHGEAVPDPDLFVAAPGDVFYLVDPASGQVHGVDTLLPADPSLCDPDRDAGANNRLHVSAETAPDENGRFVARVTWNRNSNDRMQIRAGTPDGKVMVQTRRTEGEKLTGPWARDGMRFFLATETTTGRWLVQEVAVARAVDGLRKERARNGPIAAAPSDAWRNAGDAQLGTTLTMSWFSYVNCLASPDRIDGEIAVTRQLIDDRLQDAPAVCPAG